MIDAYHLARLADVNSFTPVQTRLRRFERVCSGAIADPAKARSSFRKLMEILKSLLISFQES